MLGDAGPQLPPFRLVRIPPTLTEKASAVRIDDSVSILSRRFLVINGMNLLGRNVQSVQMVDWQSIPLDNLA